MHTTPWTSIEIKTNKNKTMQSKAQQSNTNLRSTTMCKWAFMKSNKYKMMKRHVFQQTQYEVVKWHHMTHHVNRTKTTLALQATGQKMLWSLCQMLQEHYTFRCVQVNVQSFQAPDNSWKPDSVTLILPNPFSRVAGNQKGNWKG